MEAISTHPGDYCQLTLTPGQKKHHQQKTFKKSSTKRLRY